MSKIKLFSNKKLFCPGAADWIISNIIEPLLPLDDTLSTTKVLNDGTDFLFDFVGFLVGNPFPWKLDLMIILKQIVDKCILKMIILSEASFSTLLSD